MVLFLLLIPLCFFNSALDQYNVTWSILVALSGLVVYWRLKAITAWWPPLIVPYLFINCAWIIYRGNHYQSVSILTRTALQSYSMQYLFTGICCGLIVFLYRKHWARAMAVIGFADALYVIVQRLILMKAPYFCGGLLGNASLNACFIATTMPLMMKYFNARICIVIIAISSISILFCGSTMGILALLFMGVYSIYLSLGIKKAAIYGSFMAVGLFMFGMATSGAGFLSSSNRLYMWKFFMTRWYNMPWKFNLFGAGVGTFPVFSSDWQQYFKVALPAWWSWMHNDLLDLLFEGGVIGVVLALMAWFYLYLKSRQLSIYFHTSFMTFSLISLGNHPFHVPLTALLGGYLIMGCINQRRNNAESYSEKD